MAEDKKGAQRLGAYLVFIDESGFMMITPLAKTWAPRGQTPTVYCWQKHDRISVISALSVSPKRHRVGLYYQMHQKNIQWPEVCEFLRSMLRHLRGPIVVIWDNGKIHKGDGIRRFLAGHPQLRVEPLPGYAPELNPDEGVWDYTKDTMANGRPDNIGQLRRSVRGGLRKLQRSQPSLRACFYKSALPRPL